MPSSLPCDVVWYLVTMHINNANYGTRRHDEIDAKESNLGKKG